MEPAKMRTGRASATVVIAMDAFKGCISSVEAAGEVKAGILSETPDVEVRCLPVADGGEGTLDALSLGLGGTWITRQVTGPLGALVDARYLILSDGTALLELAAASGLPLVSEEDRNPLRTTTYGTGELMRDALDHGCRNLYLGVGGSATNDGGAGLLEALGARFLDASGETVRFGPKPSVNPDLPVSVHGGGALDRVVAVDVTGLHPAVKEMHLTVACDVTNPLCGPTGASHVFGPQKGATPELVEQLDGNLLHYARVVTVLTGVDVSDMPGSGAAGGVNASLVPFLGAVLRPGVQWVLEAVGLREQIQDADLVITGEGRMDGQSVYGKAPVGVAAVAKKRQLPVIAIVGDTGDEVEAVYRHGVDRILKLRRAGMSVAESMDIVRERLRDAGARVARECLKSNSQCQALVRCDPDTDGPMEA